MKYLFGITIGPVQSFIIESRKLKDLYNSSKIISYFSKAIIIDKLKNNEKIKKEVIYPCIKTDNVDYVDYSNYLIIELEPEKEINLKEYIENIINEVFDDLAEKLKEKVSKENTLKALKENFHVFWAVVEIKEENLYKNSYNELNTLIKSLKNTYEFDNKFEQEEGKYKCSICGKRNGENKDNEEILCDLCYFKRKFDFEKTSTETPKNSFPSVYDISIHNWENTIHKNGSSYEKIIKSELSKNHNIHDNHNEYLKYINFENKKYYNPDEFKKIINIMENKDSNNLKKCEEYKKEINKSINKLNEKYLNLIYKSLINIYKDNKIPKPNFEYCFIQFDIDSLGKWMSSEKVIKSKDLQREFSEELSNFSERISCKIKDEDKAKDVKVIYSGGDDFLAVTSLERLEYIFYIIDESYKELLPKLKKYFGYENKLTYSLSVTIAQCKDPMSYALEKTRLELNNVKERYDSKYQKDGVAINYIINNGKEITAYMKKSEFKELLELKNYYKNLSLDKNKISFSYIDKIFEEFKVFDYKKITNDEKNSLYEIMSEDIKRIILRSIDKKEYSEYIRELNYFIRETIKNNTQEYKSNYLNIDFKNIINVLKIHKKICETNFIKLKDGNDKNGI
ncbi:CRISPR-associated Cmr2 family protein [Oceanotoga teriensis]|uniref:CRISPR-associated Cmr2 family protein n=1 Tax=Oceanotoga teriensis TaxID=515440 RepID=A0AA45C5T6_9BACT|nr:type III-B CRISPR-associated protein Cas10/Cmr2 [Oceanotoga teriensis]PWJ90014.1 CRISPR-associated Cmr2 family protein [Oceanotoga teriensis]